MIAFGPAVRNVSNAIDRRISVWLRTVVDLNGYRQPGDTSCQASIYCKPEQQGEYERM